MNELEVRDLVVTTPRGVRLVDEVSLAVEAGGRVGVIGESGSGKSLTALAIMQLLPETLQSSGEILFEGSDMLAMPERSRCNLRGNRLAMVFQEPMTALNPLMRVGRQIAEVLTIHSDDSRRSAALHAKELLERVEIRDPLRVARAYPHELSGGQRQRVMLAMAVACGPALLLADEPTTALDVTVQARVLGLLDKLVAESSMSLLLISHDIAVVSGICRRLVVMYGGRVVETGDAGEILRAPLHPYTAGLLHASAALAAGPDPSEPDPSGPGVSGPGPSGPDPSEPDPSGPGASASRPGRPRPGRPSPGRPSPAGHRFVLPTIPGAVPDPADLPSGCVFRDRCDRAGARCMARPVLGPAGSSHLVACWHPLADASSGSGSDASRGSGSVDMAAAPFAAHNAGPSEITAPGRR